MVLDRAADALGDLEPDARVDPEQDRDVLVAETAEGQLRCLDLDEDKVLPGEWSKGVKNYAELKAAASR